MSNDIHPRTGSEIAAQIWCEPDHASKEMDAAMCASIAREIDREQRATDAWYETAAQHCRNEFYYRGLLDEIGALLGDEAFICDDGSRSEDVLRAKLPALLKKRICP